MFQILVPLLFEILRPTLLAILLPSLRTFLISILIHLPAMACKRHQGRIMAKCSSMSFLLTICRAFSALVFFFADSSVAGFMAACIFGVFSV